MHIQQDVKTIGLIGSGHIGSTVAKAVVAAGFDVVVQQLARDPRHRQSLFKSWTGKRAQQRR